MRQVTRWLGTLGSLVLVLGGCDEVKESFDKGFKTSFEKSFGEACTRTAVSEGAPEEKAKPICECAGNYLVTHHDTVTLTKLSATTESAESQQKTSEAIGACTANTP